VETVNQYLFGALDRYGDLVMQVHRDRTWTYREAARAAHGVALHLREKGVQPGDRVALIAENSPQWLHAFAGVLAIGGVVVPRGEDISNSELELILEHSGSRVVFAGTKRVAERIPDGFDVIPMEGGGFPEPADLAEGTLADYAASRDPSDLVVLLYTSGTTGRPKGVMLEQRNIAHNIRVLPGLVGMGQGDVWVSILPSWHTFEQTVELCGFAVGCITVYSDKRRLTEDLRKHRPHFFASVPRIWEAIYDKATSAIQKKGCFIRSLFHACLKSSRMWRKGNPLGLPLHFVGRKLFYGKITQATGGQLKFAVSGGGYLPPHIDDFFALVGIELLIGYGLTETAPVLALRRPEDNVLGTIGRAVPETEIRISPSGTIQARGPQIMRGYYKDEDLTRQVLDEDGWFDTGDLGRLTGKGDLIFVGRQKETIVLSGGENVEPEPIENSILCSPLIQQVLLVGQDRKSLGALVHVDPDSGATKEQLLEELRARTGTPAGFRSFEAVHRFALLEEPFSVENGLLTATLKMKRGEIAGRYAELIDSVWE
jgi:long-chain acyl-CoA synthetase